MRDDAHLTAEASENFSQVLSLVDMDEMMDETLWAIHDKYVTEPLLSLRRSR